ncbi:MAG TPA: hypothetical protein VE175_07450 [Woeseiaceae bacterium]|nr:hypothetical protein [Woeseiaceae bacterium]
MRWRTAAAAGLAILALLAGLFSTRHVLSGWLTAMLVVSALPAGALPLLLVWHLHRGRWGIVLGPAMAAAVGTMPLIVVGMLPILLFAGAFYPWAHASGEHVSPWLSQPGFALRGLGYLALWWLFGELALRSGVPAENTPPRPALASAGLIVYTLTASLAGFDWTLSLQPRVYSSIFGLIFVIHQVLAALGFLTMVSLGAKTGREEARGIGNLLLGMVMFWMYLEYMQYLIVWSGNLPGHIDFYLARTGGPSSAAVWTLAIGGGAVPLLLLLSSRVRESGLALGALAGVLFASRLLEAAWWVLPVVEPDGALLTATTAALAGAGGLWLAVWHRRRRARSAAAP